MITFKQFLNEETVDSELKDLLEHDCAHFLSESKRQGFLLRGMRTIESRSDVHTMENPFPKLQKKAFEDDEDPTETSHILFWEREVRQDREPADTPTKLHHLLDNWFDKNFGFQARSKALFCNGSAEVAAVRSYGKVYLIFPIGTFKYVWSPNVTDLYAVAGTMPTEYYWDEFGDKVPTTPVEAVDRFMTRRKYTDENLNEAVQDRNEIMVGCRKYYAFEYRYRPMLEKLLGIK